jgi:hypothetical protein
MKTHRTHWLFATLLAASVPALAHHSYALFDLKQRRSVEGTVAKLEWTNPHTFVWIYVKGKQGYDLYSFESGSVAMLKRFGWTPTTLAKGEKVTIEYFPLRDGRNGGAFIRAIHADGHVTANEPDAPGGTGSGAFDKSKGSL